MPQDLPQDLPVLAVVIPSFRAAATIGTVLAAIGPEVGRIYVVDDGCPDSTGLHVAAHFSDRRITVLHNSRNLGVGGAMKHGYRHALADGAEIIVKLDSDGQMDPGQILLLIEPILRGEADYSKGNRLAPIGLMPPGTSVDALKAMPLVRRVANRLLSVLHKGATGYWRIGDPANGYTAVHAEALRRMKLDELADCFFFETDMLFSLRKIGATVADVPLPARYSDEVSNVSLRRVAPRFGILITVRLAERLARGLGARLLTRPLAGTQSN
ncbi:MAG TPA: glycosyltransferase family 2 protein [Allosphingosinicella sp.]|nr:glycosyltransferase family 2 protein [Allosphingosinicella sp.]